MKYKYKLPILGLCLTLTILGMLTLRCYTHLRTLENKIDVLKHLGLKIKYKDAETGQTLYFDEFTEFIEALERYGITEVYVDEPELLRGHIVWFKHKGVIFVSWKFG